MEGVGIFWCLVEMLHEQGGYMRTEYERIAFELHCDCDKVKWIIEESGLFLIKDEMFYSESALSRINTRNTKSAKATESANKRWNNANALPTHCEPNASKGKERKGNKRKEKEIYSDIVYFENSELNDTFISFLENRKKLKHPATERAIELLLKTLNSFPSDEYRIKSLNKSITNGWRDVFTIKNGDETRNTNEQMGMVPVGSKLLTEADDII